MIPQAMFQATPRGIALPIAHCLRPPMHDPPTTERALGGHVLSLRCLVGNPGSLRTCLSSLLELKYPTSESSSRPLISTGSKKAIIAKALKASTTGAPHYRKSCAKPKIQFSQSNSQIVHSLVMGCETPHLVSLIDTILTLDVNSLQLELFACCTVKNHLALQQLRLLLARPLKTRSLQVRQS